MLTLFDFDGTLSDTQAAIVAGLRTMVDERLPNAPGDDVLIAHVERGMSLHATIRSLHPEPASIEHEIEEWADHYRTAYAGHAPGTERLYDGAVEAVTRASELGDVVVVSMKHSRELERSISRLGLAPLIQAFYGDDGQTPLKPHRELWHNAISPAFPQHAEADTLMIGDTGHDLEFAKNANLKSCWASYGYGRTEHCRQVGFDYEAGSATALLNVINEFAQV